MSFRLARLGRRGLDEDDVRDFCARVEAELVQLLEERAALYAELRRLRGHPQSRTSGRTPSRSHRPAPHGAAARRDTPPGALGAPVIQPLSAPIGAPAGQPLGTLVRSPVSERGGTHADGDAPAPHRSESRRRNAYWPDAGRRRGQARIAQRDARGRYGRTGLFREDDDSARETGGPYAADAAGEVHDQQDDDHHGGVRGPGTGGPRHTAGAYGGGPGAHAYGGDGGPYSDAGRYGCVGPYGGRGGPSGVGPYSDGRYGDGSRYDDGAPYRRPGGPGVSHGAVPPPGSPAPGPPAQAVSILAKAQQTAERCMADAQAYSREVAHDALRRREQILAEASARAALMLEQAHRAVTRTALDQPAAPRSDPAREHRSPY